ncbi:MAG TPA: carboxypeptidase-like regulatory domain-containing protein [Gemmatimonadales bacterium]|nr:carboxypeptidase-like regulatory domain-containing protein [Gemmatimonadales bacterium]
MPSRALIPTCLLLMLACSDSPVEPTTQQPPSRYVFFGVVEGIDGTPLAGAMVHLFGPGPIALDSAVTEETGSFVFRNLRGQVTVTVTRSGYVTESRVVLMTQDVISHIRLAPWPDAQVLTLGEWIQSQVLGAAPPCDPIAWDGDAPCRKFLFEAPLSGKLSVTLEWSGSPELDATLVTMAGDYVGTSKPVAERRHLLEGPVVMGQSYEVRVSSYYGPQDFRLRAELNP